LLVAALVAVLGMGVYLFIQVKATPAQASATYVTPRETRDEPRPAPAPSSPTPPPPRPAGDDHERKPGWSKPLWRRPTASTGDTATPPSDDHAVNLKLENLMELANKAYDAQDFDQAVAIAGKILDKQPDNVRMLRIMVSANCIQGDSALAQQHYERLPKFDREQMKARCERYGVTFKDPP
jgi:hypothetical protein